MKKKHTLTLILLLAALTLAAQSNYSPCYTSNMSKGNTAFSQGRYSEARTYYVNAKQCAGGNPSEAQQKINACDAKIKERTGVLSIEPLSAAAVYSKSGLTLYAGITNTVFFSAPNTSSKYSVQIPNCKVKRSGPGEMSVEVPTSLVGSTIAAAVISEQNGNKKALSSTVFNVKQLPDPIVTIANIKGGKWSKGDILADPIVRVVMDDSFAYDLTWTVNSFRVIIFSKGMEEPVIECQGNTLSEKAQSSIQKAAVNTVVYISAISVSCGDVTKELDGINIRIR